MRKDYVGTNKIYDFIGSDTLPVTLNRVIRYKLLRIDQSRRRSQNLVYESTRFFARITFAHSHRSRG